MHRVGVVDIISIWDNFVNKYLVAVSTNVTNQEVPITTEYGLRNETFRIQLQKQDLPQGQSLLVRLNFIGRLSDTLNGFYKTSYKTRRGETQ